MIYCLDLDHVAAPVVTGQGEHCPTNHCDQWDPPLARYTAAKFVANILYGVNGEGSGHSTRAKVSIAHLQGSGHLVHVVSFDRGLRNLRDYFNVTEIYGLRLAYVNNRVRYRRTLAKNLLTVRQAARSVSQLEELAQEWKIQLVITDFEPLSCHVGHRLRLPIISIDNQHCLTHTDVSYPRKYRRDAAVAKLVTRMMVPHADMYLVTSFFGAAIRRQNTFLFPPILREEILSASPKQAEHVLVYVTSAAPDLAGLLSSIPCEFVAYGFGREGREGNVLFKSSGVNTFLEDLISAKAVIANAGFSLLTEALHLGKPYLAMPIKHQFEQIFNAYWLERMGYGTYWAQLNKERIEAFLYNLPHYREKLVQYPRQGNQALLEKVDSLVNELTSSRKASVGC
jgi:uncharacterized protein (TIGR00661 family)